MARIGFFKHTRHGGGKYRANNLLELHQWYYRSLFHRANQKAIVNSSQITRAIALQKKQRKESAWHQSLARDNLQTWRQTKVRVGRRWVSASSGPSPPVPQTWALQNADH